MAEGNAEWLPDGFNFSGAHHSGSHSYLLPTLSKLLADHRGDKRIFEVGCGNGSLANWLTGRGYNVIGIDASKEGIELANEAYPKVRLEQGSAYEPLADTYGQFPIVLSFEVVEHLYYPHKYAQTVFDLVEPGGTAILSTPYHGYWKNLAIALSGKSDHHFNSLNEGGHIKFWSYETLTQLLAKAGFEAPTFYRVGRIPPLAKSMIAVVQRPR